MSMHAVFSIDDSAYLAWQGKLLAYSYRRVGQPGPLTCLRSSNAPPATTWSFMFQTRSWSYHPETGDHYPPYNLMSALTTWLQEAPPAEETILLLEPDNILLRPLEVSVERGRPIAQPIGYMEPSRYREALLKFCENPEELEPIGNPVAIHRDDLAELAPLWLAKTVALRNDPLAREQIGWISMMWGYCLAAAELGLRHELREMAQFQTEDRADLPIIHYCFESQSPDKRWQWSKRTYRPWERVAEPPPGVPAASVALIRLLNQLVDLKQARAARKP